MIEPILLGLALLAAAAVMVAVVEALVRRAELGAALLLAATLLIAILVERIPSVTLPGGIRVQLHDVVFAPVPVAGILRMPGFSPLQRWMVLLCSMLPLSLVRGDMAFGPFLPRQRRPDRAVLTGTRQTVEAGDDHWSRGRPCGSAQSWRRTGPQPRLATSAITGKVAG